MTYRIRLSDGTYCYSGPTCRKHGIFTSQDLPSKTPQRRVAADPVDYGFLPKDAVRKGWNDGTHETQIAELNRLGDSLKELLSRQEHNALLNYAFTGYKVANPYLRAGIEGLKAEDRRYGEDNVADEASYLKSAERAQESIAVLDSALQKAPRLTETPSVLYRYFRVRTPGRKPKASDVKSFITENYEPGKIVTFDSYVSASADSDYMLMAASRNPQEMFVYEIVTKKNDGVSLSRTPRTSSTSIQDLEREILLPRGKRFKVVDVLKATYESSFGEDVDDGLNFHSRHPKNHRFTVVQLVEID